MPAGFNIVHDGNEVIVTKQGQLVVTPLSYSQSKYVELATANTAYNFFFPGTSKQFIITGLYMKADKQVSSTVDADVIIYEADSEDTATVDKVLFQTAMVQGDQVNLGNPNIVVTEGKYINGKTTDDDIHVTLSGYYIAV